MSQSLINRNPDLLRLQNEGYEVSILSGHVLVSSVPYLNSQGQICHGTLVSTLALSGEQTITPDTHVIYFIGEIPHNYNGTVIQGIQHGQNINQTLAENLTVNHSFSNKPSGGYRDYYEKFYRYIEIISAQARHKEPTLTAKTFKVIESHEDSVFHYTDTNSSRAGIRYVNERLRNQRIAIVGIGGTGSYILDLVAKTPVGEIHLFDGDDLLQHNAFRAPGAPSLEELQSKQKKAEYFASIYGKMHRHIMVHPDYVGQNNVYELEAMNFVFLCVDKGTSRKLVVEKLVECEIPFVDVGIGILPPVDNSVFGHVRMTLGAADNGYASKRFLTLADDPNDEYFSNIQIADLNALNAALAVIKWKKYYGFYQDFRKEHSLTYTINTGALTREDQSL